MIEIMSSSIVERILQQPTADREFKQGASLFRQGDRVRWLFVVVAGEVHLVRHQVGGAQLIFQRVSSGSILAEASVFSDRYHCDAVAVRATRARVVDVGLLRSALTRNPDFGNAWMAYLAHEVQATRLRAEILTLRRVSDRLDAWIASQEGRMPERGEWRSVASAIGTSPEALYRELARRRNRRSSPSGRSP